MEESLPKSRRAARRAPVQMLFCGDGIKVEVSSVISAERRSVELAVLLETFLTSLTWLCSSGKVPQTGWLTVTVWQGSALCRVEPRAGDSTSLSLVPVTRRMPTAVWAAIQAFSRNGTAHGGQIAWRPWRSYEDETL